MQSQKILDDFAHKLENLVDNAIIKAKCWHATHFNKYEVVYPVSKALELETKRSLLLESKPGITEIVAAYYSDTQKKADIYLLVKHNGSEYKKTNFIFESYKKVGAFRTLLRFLSDSFQYDLNKKISIQTIEQNGKTFIACYKKQKDKIKYTKKAIGFTSPLKGELSSDALEKLSYFNNFLDNFINLGGF